MSRYVVIGGSGFLGSNFIEKVGAEKCVSLDIVKPKNEAVEYKYCDISDKIDFCFEPDDIVIHLAARQYHLKVPAKDTLNFFCDVNVQGTQNVLEKMSANRASKMIYFSTDMVYGIPLFVPVTTEHPQNPVGEYGMSKKLSEEICRKYREKGFNITIFRPRMIVGKGRLGILVKLFKLIEKNLPVPMIGSGNNCYQMVSVDDCSAAIIKAIEKGVPNNEFNLGSKNPPKVKNLLRDLIKENNSKSILIPTWGFAVKSTLRFLSLFGIRIMYKEQYTIADIDYTVSIDKTEELLDWNPMHNDSKMLQESFKLYRSMKNS